MAGLNLEDYEEYLVLKGVKLIKLFVVSVVFLVFKFESSYIINLAFIITQTTIMFA